VVDVLAVSVVYKAKGYSILMHLRDPRYSALVPHHGPSESVLKYFPISGGQCLVGGG
jgi:hypothetical protein